MDKEKLEESVLINLRSVILSSKGGIPLNRLQNDYRQLIGSNIPLAQLGYSSIENFIQNIPQVAKLKRNPDGQIFIEAVANSSTVHLQKLISKQKGAGVSKYSAKAYGKKSTSIQKSGPSISREKEASLEKDKIIEDLKSRLEKEKKINQDFASQVVRLNLSLQTCRDALKTEQETNKLLKNQIEISRASNQKQNANGIGALTELLGKLYESKKTSDSCSLVNKDSCTHCSLYSTYEKQCSEIETLKSVLLKQNIRMQKIENKLNQQSQTFENYARKFSTPLDLNGLTQMLLKHLKVAPPNIAAQNTTKVGQESGPSGSEIAGNSSNRSLSSPAVSQISEPPKAKTAPKKRRKKKPKVVVGNTKQ